MKTNPISFLLISALMASMMVGFTALTILSLDISYEQEAATYTFDAAGIEGISVTDTNGEVRLTGSDTGVILIEIEKETYLGEDSLEDVDVNVSVSEGELLIRVTYDMDLPFFTVNIEVDLPREVVARDVHLTNGHMDLTDMDRVEKARVANGGITLNGIGTIGTVSLDNGDVSVSRTGSIGSIQVDNGNIDVADAGRIGTLDVVNGDLGAIGVVSVDRASVDRGNIDLDVDGPGVNGTVAEVVSGDLSVRLASSSSYTFDLEAVNGAVEVSGFQPVYSRDRYDDKEGTVNGGGPELECRVRNGSITVEARRGD
jgi:DUF4097 and DUF4098 domain-containing protein YvlB